MTQSTQLLKPSFASSADTACCTTVARIWAAVIAQNPLINGKLASLNLVARLYVDLLESVKHGPTEQMRRTFEFLDIPDNYEPNDEECLEAVSVVLAEWITEGMQGTEAGLVSTSRLDVHPRGPATFLLAQLPPDLLAAAYGQFALLIANKAPISTCPGCGRLFNPKSGKQKYCTSSCASTSRWRRWKDRQAE
jgi:hypothetical protein